MSKILYFQCFSGISGDMCLGSLVDLGVDPDYLCRQLKNLPVDHYKLEFSRVKRRGIGALKVDVLQTRAQSFGTLEKVIRLIDGSSLSDWVKEKTITAFTKLAHAEATVHREPVEKIHFHETGALDAIIDIAGTFICVEYLNPACISVSSLPLGGGYVQCAHGLLPVPAPATLELLKGVPVNNDLPRGELVTPTGAAIVTTLTGRFGLVPAGVIVSAGYGAGTKDFDHPNVLRTMLIKPESTVPAASGGGPPAQHTDQVGVIETAVDDMTGEALGFLLEKLLRTGALDCFYTPIFMKKNRPAQKITIIFEQENEHLLLTTLFTHATTFGVRIFYQHRIILKRSCQPVTTPYGLVQLKLGYYANRLVQVSPEFQDCARLAREHDISLDSVYQAALQAFECQKG